MAKFDRKNLEKSNSKTQVEYNDPLENFEGSKTELLFKSFQDFCKASIKIFIGIGVFVVATVALSQ